MRNGDMNLTQLGTGFSAPLTAATRIERERARCMVARQSRSHRDYLMLLDVLGLTAR